MPEPHPVRLAVSDDLKRSRWTVGFRLILALPHLIMLGLLVSVATLLLPFAWIIALVRGELPQSIHDFFARVVRYTVHVNGYLYLAAEPWPPFLGEREYVIDVAIPEPVPQGRWGIGFRLVLALPAFLLAGAVGASGLAVGSSAFYFNLGLLPAAMLLGWFACLARGAMPRGLRDAVAYGLGYGAQVTAYLFLLTPVYPDSDPAQARLEPVPPHPVALTVTDDDLRRHRLLVFFHGALVMPHLVWSLLWGLAVFLTSIAAWLMALLTGRVPDELHRFAAAFVRYQTHLQAFWSLAGNPFPGFTGAPGRYPLELTVGPPEPQSRWSVLFRLVLALPALLLAGALNGVQGTAALLGWFVALFTGRLPRGLRNVSAWATRYGAQTWAYLLLVTSRYPFTGPGSCD